MTKMAAQLLKELEEALVMFGEYSFDDKGCFEVMDLYSTVNQIKKLPPDIAGLILKEVSEGGRDGRGEVLRDSLYGELQEMPDDWFEEVGNISGAEL